MNPDERIDHALEGCLPPDQQAQLQRDVIDDPQVRRLYAERAMLHGELFAAGDSLLGLLDDEHDAAPARRLTAATIGWAAAAALVAAALVWTVRPDRAPTTPVAVLAEADGCRWAGSELPTNEGATLGAGRLALVEGVATIAFESGAVVTMEAPTTLEITSPMHCRLVEGSVVADVPEQAHGFTIDTPGLEVIDLGTRFGVTTASGNAQVYVFEGEVEVSRGGESERLTTGKSLHVGTTPPAVEDGELQRETVLEQAESGWLSVPTSYGDGKDAYVRRGDSHGPTGSHPLLMVKHTELAAGNERRAYLSFDLSQIAAGAVQDAELVLAVRSSGLGFSALVPDSEFSVWGIGSDRWDESQLLWENAPAMDLESAAAERLGGFEIARGAGAGEVRVRSDQLARFLRETRDGLATFIIVRDTGESDKQGLVHAFASREHPTAPPPTLRLKIR